MASGIPASSGYVSPHRNLASLKRYVLNAIQGASGDEELASVAQDAINVGIDDLNTRNWKQIIGQQDIALVADDADYALASDYGAPRYAERLNSDGEAVGRIGGKSLRTFLEEHPDRSSAGDIHRYTVNEESRLVIFHEMPSQGFIDTYPTVRLWYHRRLPHLMGDADTLSAVPPEFWAYLGAYGRFELLAVRGEASVAQIWERRTAARWQQLQTRDNETETDWSA